MTVNDLIGKVRIAIDEVVVEGADEDFDDLLDTEIRQALFMAGRRLLSELPVEHLPVTTLTDSDINVHVTNSDGSGQIGLADNFLRFVELRLASWKNSVWDLVEPGSNLAVMQACDWTRGCPEKPKAMMGPAVTKNNVTATRSLRYWTAGKTSNQYNHTIEVLAYVKDLDSSQDTDLLKLADAHELRLVYLASGILMEGKQHGDLAERFYRVAESAGTTPQQMPQVVE